MTDALYIAAVVVVSYLIGNINAALIISKAKHTDVRKMGSGNPGTMNIIRNFGKKWGALTLILDAAKGALPCLIGWFVLGERFSFYGGRMGIYIGAISVIVGHIFPVFLRFRGGKGIASSIGVCLVINPIATLISFAVGVAFILLTKIGSITSFIIICIPLALEAYRLTAGAGELASQILIFAIFALTLFAHRKNLVKLFLGTESKTVLVKRKTKGETPAA